MDASTALRALLRPTISDATGRKNAATQQEKSASSKPIEWPSPGSHDEDTGSNSLVDLSLSESEPSRSPVHQAVVQPQQPSELVKRRLQADEQVVQAPLKQQLKQHSESKEREEERQQLQLRQLQQLQQLQLQQLEFQQKQQRQEEQLSKQAKPAAENVQCEPRSPAPLQRVAEQQAPPPELGLDEFQTRKLHKLQTQPKPPEVASPIQTTHGHGCEPAAYSQERNPGQQLPRAMASRADAVAAHGSSVASGLRQPQHHLQQLQPLDPQQVHAVTTGSGLQRHTSLQHLQSPHAVKPISGQQVNTQSRGDIASLSSQSTPQQFAWFQKLSREQRQSLRRCSSARSARELLAAFSREATSGAPAGLIEELRRQTQALLQQSIDLEEELAQQAEVHAAQLAAVEEEHRRSKRRSKLQLLAQWAPHRTAAIEALSCVANPSLHPAAAALAYGSSEGRTGTAKQEVSPHHALAV